MLSYMQCGGEGWLGFPDLWSGQKLWWKIYITPVVNFGEVRRAQLAKSTLMISTLVPLWSFEIFKVCSDAKGRVGCGKQREAIAPIQPLVNLQPWILRWNTFFWAELQPWCLSLQWKTCPWAKHSDYDDDDDGEGWLGFPDLWSGQKHWWNWYLTPVVNFGVKSGGPS